MDYDISRLNSSRLEFLSKVCGEVVSLLGKGLKEETKDGVIGGYRNLG